MKFKINTFAIESTEFIISIPVCSDMISVMYANGASTMFYMQNLDAAKAFKEKHPDHPQTEDLRFIVGTSLDDEIGSEDDHWGYVRSWTDNEFHDFHLFVDLTERVKKQEQMMLAQALLNGAPMPPNATQMQQLLIKK